MERRDFVRNSILTGTGLLATSGISNIYSGSFSEKAKIAPPLLGNRFVTLCIMVRTSPWEVSRDIKLHPRDEGEFHTLKIVRDLREIFSSNNPGGRLTWGFTFNALIDKRSNYEDIRKYAAECHHKYGDEVSYFPGYFPALYLPRKRVNKDMSEAVQIISGMVGNGYRPQSIMGGFLSAENMRYLAEEEDIHVAHGVIWSQHAVDGGGADGSPNYPYYPSKEHFCKPAQNKNDFIDCVNLDGWSVDFLNALTSGGIPGTTKYNGASSRRGVGPIETYCEFGLEAGHACVMHTQSLHFDRGFELNGFGWIPNIWEAALVMVPERINSGREFIHAALAKWVGETRKRWEDVQFITFGEFGEIWRRHYKNNDEWNYRFEEKGLGIGSSFGNLEVRWFVNKSFRLALLHNWHKNTPEKVVDFTRYDLPAKEPRDPSPDHPITDWSLMNRMNQKGLRPQDKPVLLSELTKEEQGLIAGYYPELL